MSIGDNIQITRQAAGLTQERLAAEIRNRILPLTPMPCTALP
jgi:transcriptional regulator with XRE-family HTH domain